ncbi:hypothetical protein FRC09_020456 [Ceratobasidium sp. 395]|nr:hypothetical protein FRC09_020456 [Ceratobasidium sp. 395]
MAKLIGWDEDLLFLSYGPKLKRYRTMLNKALNNRVSLDYIPLQLHEVRRFMQRLVQDPDGFMDHIHLMAASIAVRIAYGYKVESSDDRLVQMAEELTTGFSDVVTPARWMVDMIPPLRYLPEWFPLAAFQRRAQHLRRLDQKYREEPFEYVQKQLAEGIAEDSYTSKLLLSNSGKPIDEKTRIGIRNTASNLYGGASDATVSIVQSFFLAMTLFPQVQAKAQAEVDEYLKQRPDGERMILPADRANLPYTSALVRETLRWHPVINAVAHFSGDMDDDNVIAGGKTYRIPARSLIIANTWQMMHDPAFYDQPELFMPERYLRENPPPDPENYAFGFGRRICPGMYIAHQSMWISIR